MQSLQHHFIIAMPSMKDGYFERTVTYICEHNKEGAMGLVINQPIELKVKDLLDKMQISTEDKDFSSNPPIYAGGPVAPERGFILHKHQTANWSHSVVLRDDLLLTTSKDILESMGTELAPKDYLIALGYAGWEPGQLEQELQDNAWLTIPAEEDILFEVPIHQRWEMATEKLGFNPWQISGEIGHA